MLVNGAVSTEVDALSHVGRLVLDFRAMSAVNLSLNAAISVLDYVVRSVHLAITVIFVEQKVEN